MSIEWSNPNRPTPALLFPGIEAEHLRILYDLVDVDAYLEDPEIVEWFDRKGIERINEQKRAFAGILRKRQEALLATVAVMTPVSGEATPELAASRLAKRSRQAA